MKEKRKTIVGEELNNISNLIDIRNHTFYWKNMKPMDGYEPSVPKNGSFFGLVAISNKHTNIA